MSQKATIPASADARTNPPTTPPAIAAVFVFLSGGPLDAAPEVVLAGEFEELLVLPTFELLELELLL